MMLQLFVLALITYSNVHSQALNRGDPGQKYLKEPAGYTVPDGGYVSLYEQQESPLEERQIQQYKPTRRTERVPSPTYQYSSQNENNVYYQTRPRAQPQESRQIPQENYPYQLPQFPQRSQVDYEQILRNNQIARLQLASRKAVPTVEQYLKEVTPTTKTNYQRPTNYLRFNSQPVKQEQVEEPQQPKQAQFQYSLPAEAPQSEKSFVNYQFDGNVEQQKQPTQYKPHFNLVAYQNALLQQQKLLENQENSTPKSAIYVTQNVAKKPSNPNKIPIKIKQIPQRIVNTEQQFLTPQINFQSQLELEHEKLQQIQRQFFGQHPPQSTAQVKYQQSISKFSPKDNVQYHSVDDLLQYQEQHKESQQQQQQQPPPQQQVVYKSTKSRTQNKPEPIKFYSEEQVDEQIYEYQTTPSSSKYQTEEPEYQKPLVKRPTKYYEPKIKYQPPQPIRNQEESDERYSQNQQETVRQSLIKRLPQQYQEEPTIVRHPLHNLRYQPQRIRQYPEESQQFSEYRQTDLPYQTESSERYRTIHDESAAYRPHFQSPSNKYYRTLRRPASSYSFIE